MCNVCDWYETLTPAHKSAPALSRTGARTLHGFYDPRDAEIMARHYPNVDRQTIEGIAGAINNPRMAEVLGTVEMVQRFRESSFSSVRGGADIKVAINPLSILFWSRKHNAVYRIKTPETELMHIAAEKMALRRRSMKDINALLWAQDGLHITHACSCCVIALHHDDRAALYGSDYYNTREGLGRAFDSDVLTGEGLFESPSVRGIPDKILAATADFGPAEVKSYLRMTDVAQTILTENPVTPDMTAERERARRFLLGDTVARYPAA